MSPQTKYDINYSIQRQNIYNDYLKICCRLLELLSLYCCLLSPLRLIWRIRMRTIRTFAALSTCNWKRFVEIHNCTINSPTDYSAQGIYNVDSAFELISMWIFQQQSGYGNSRMASCISHIQLPMAIAAISKNRQPFRRNRHNKCSHF